MTVPVGRRPAPGLRPRRRRPAHPAGLRGVPADRVPLGPSAAVPDLRARRLLRLSPRAGTPAGTPAWSAIRSSGRSSRARTGGGASSTRHRCDHPGDGCREEPRRRATAGRRAARRDAGPVRGLPPARGDAAPGAGGVGGAPAHDARGRAHRRGRAGGHLLRGALRPGRRRRGVRDARPAGGPACTGPAASSASSACSPGSRPSSASVVVDPGEVLAVPADRLRAARGARPRLRRSACCAAYLRPALAGARARGSGSGSSAPGTRPTPGSCASSPPATGCRTGSSTWRPTRRPSGCSAASGSVPTTRRSCCTGTGCCATPSPAELAAAFGLRDLGDGRGESATWWSSAPARPGSRPLSTAPRRASTPRCSTASRRAGRRRGRRASRTTSASPPGSPGASWPSAPCCRPRSSGRGGPSRRRWWGWRSATGTTCCSSPTAVSWPPAR